jgi:hypothetical protein
MIVKDLTDIIFTNKKSLGLACSFRGEDQCIFFKPG